ncbi:MAG: PAS domain-containing protein [Nitrospirae bacterium]|nr:PAS domain-containing protein [Nitrospirota bacterium]
MNRVLRQSLILGALLVLVLVVHQQLRIQAADHIIFSPLVGEYAQAQWREAGEGTGALLRMLAGGGLFMLVWSLVRGGPARHERRHAALAAIAPLTDALTDLKAREAAGHREKAAAVARMTQMQAVHTTILEGITSGALTVDQHGRVATCNRAATRILGWTGPAPIGRPVAELFKGHLPPVLAAGNAPPPGGRAEFAWQPRGALARHLGLSVSPIDTAQGPLTALLFTDLTELKRLQAQVALRRHLAQLGEVSAGIAHEFRNNMGAVLGYARLISHDTQPGTPQRELVDAMMAELTAMEGLIRALLEFGRKAEPQPALVPVAPLLALAAEVAGTGFDAAVACTVPDGLPPLWVDEALVRQALINLVRNACEAARGALDGPRVRVSARALAEGEGPAEWVVIAVSDNGPGIPAAARPKLFLPFFTTKEGGTGMGLAQVNKVVTAHGGEVTVDDVPGGGATFRLRLPTARRRHLPMAHEGES